MGKLFFKTFIIFVCIFITAESIFAGRISYQEHLYRGRLLFNRGRYNDALAEYKKAERIDPSSKSALLNQAVIYKNIRRYEQAVKTYKKLLRIESNKILYRNLGEVYYLNAMPDEAVKAFHAAVKMGQRDALTYFWLGSCFQDRRDWKNAQTAYETAITIDGRFVPAYVSLGRIYERKKMWASAQKVIERAKELDPSIPHIYPLLASIYFHQQRYEIALKAYHKLQAVEPDNLLAKKYIEKIHKKTKGQLKQKLLARDKKRLQESVARDVSLLSAKNAPLVRVHIADTKRLRFKCAADFFISDTHNQNTILFKGKKEQLYTIALRGETMILLLEERQIKDIGQAACIWHKRPQATILIFDIEAGIGNYWASKTDRIYRGALDIRLYENERMRIVNEVTMEEYLYGVIPSEMPHYWPKEALKAQAVAARSEAYAKLGRHKHQGYDFCSGVHCQVYSGAKVETEATNNAVKETIGKIAVYDGKPIDAVYSNSCGGHTQGNIFGERERIEYLQEKPDALEPIGFLFPLSPLELEDWLFARNLPLLCNNDTFSRRSNFRWIRIYTRQQLEKLIQKKFNIGKLVAIDILERNPSSHVHRIRIAGTTGEFIVEKEFNIRQLLGNLRSGMFNIDVKLNRRNQPEEFIFYGGGWGHGVGMCQVGAATMAEKGYSYDEILKFYYTGIGIEKKY